MIEEEKMKLPILQRQVSLEPETFNEKERSVKVVFSTGARVRRGGFFTEPFIEELSLKKGDVRLARLNNGAPVLDSHSSFRLKDMLGVVEKASVDGKEGRATLRFSSRDEIQGLLQDVQDGIIQNISVGYRVHKFEKVGEDDGINILRATDWEPLEISLVSAGADDGAKVRSEEDSSKNDCVVIYNREQDVHKPNTKVDPKDNKPAGTEIDNARGEKDLKPDDELDSRGNKEMLDNKAKDVEEGKKAEKIRQTEIRESVRKAKLEPSFADELLEKDFSADEARSAIIDKLAENDKKKPTSSVNPSVTIVTDERDTKVKAMTEALMFRSGIKNAKGEDRYKCTDLARQYAHSNIYDIARECVGWTGVDYRHLTRGQVASLSLKKHHFDRASGLHSTSDFPFILENVVNKTLRDSYMEAPQTFMPITRRVQASDFKEISRVQLGDAPSLLLVKQSGEVTRGTIGENAEKYALKTFARIVGVTRETIINDDLGAFTRIPELMGRAARDLETDLTWTQITSNPVMADGNALFSAAHGNVGSPTTPPDIDNLGNLRELMRKQVGLNGRLISLQVRWLAVPAELETVAETLVTTIQPDEFTKVNPFAPGGRTPLQLIVEPRLATLLGGTPEAYFGFSDVGQIDIIELAMLTGEDGPSIESREGFDVEGLEIKVRHDVAAKIIDHRGATRNVGV